MVMNKIITTTLASSFMLGGTFFGIPTGLDLVKTSFFKKENMTPVETVVEGLGVGTVMVSSYIMMGGATTLSLIASPIIVPLYIYYKKNGDCEL